MNVFNNIKIELFLFLIIALSFAVSYNPDINVHNYFKNLSESHEKVFLLGFFTKITELGNSVWYLGIALIFWFLLFSNKKMDLIKITNTDKIINFFISSIIYIVSAGLITQIIKHIVGRPRPNYFDFEDGGGFSFFTLSSNFHSFPSGHASTIFMVCLILCATLPKLKYYFFTLACIIGISRVVVGAHFFTDVVCGALVSLIVFKCLNIFMASYYKKYLFKKIYFERKRTYFYIIIILIGLCLFLTVAPDIDLYTANLFYLGNSQFSLQSSDLLSIVFRKILIPLILIYVLVLPIICKLTQLEKIFFRYKFTFKEILLIWSSLIISILIVVNLILKNLWGRARPGDVVEFGGVEAFTPWYKMSDGCVTNCSFVSGDASVGFSIVILYFITRNIIYLYSSLIFGFLLGVIRISAGGHFFSDVVFSGLVIIILNLLLFKIYKNQYGK